MRTLFSLLRINQWVKNSFIFLPPFFGGVILDASHTKPLLIGFLLYSLLASALYIINDIRDINFDKNHLLKKNRPIAKGDISISLATVISVVLILVSLIGGYLLNVSFFIILIIYFISNLAYSFGIKNYSIVDITIVALGFVYRILAGGFIANIEVSKWLLLLTFLLALFIALAKRRDDLIISKSTGEELRISAKKYNLLFINNAIILISALMVVCYIMYTFSVQHLGTNNYWVFASSLFVIMGILRYYQIVFVENNSGSPTTILYKDGFLKIVLIIWVFMFAIPLYFA